jgi:excisionase family DNA binding protein
MAERKRIIQIPNILLSVKDASVAISVSSKMVRLLIASGRLKAVNLGKRMTRISLQELTDFAKQKHPKSCVTKSWDGDVYV